MVCQELCYGAASVVVSLFTVCENVRKLCLSVSLPETWFGIWTYGAVLENTESYP